MVGDQRQLAVELFRDEGAHDREAGSLPGGRVPRPVVGDREEHTAVGAAELDPHLVAAVLERVPEQLAEDQGERGRTAAVERDLLDARADLLTGAEPLDEHGPEPLGDGVVGLIFAQHQMYDGPPHDPDDDHEVPGWRQKRGVRLAKKTRREDSLKVLRSHINHIKQATGSHRHTAIGTDFDGFIKPTLGGFQDMRDLKHLAPALREHYKPVDVEAICSDNAMRLLTGYWGAG